MSHLPASPGEALLAGLSALLERQAQALLEGRADELPALDASIRQGLLALRRGAQAGVPLGSPQVLVELQQQAAANQAMLQRRAGEVQQRLAALGAGSARFEDARARNTYAPVGGLASAGQRGQALARA